MIGRRGRKTRSKYSNIGVQKKKETLIKSKFETNLNVETTASDPIDERRKKIP